MRDFYYQPQHKQLRSKPALRTTMNPLFKVLLATAVAGLLSGCQWLAQSTQTSAIEPRQDPLIGKIIDAQSGDQVAQSELIMRAAKADVVYLGERHDNAEHHQLQRQVLQGLVDRGLRPAIGFEFFDIGQTSQLMQYVSGQATLMALGPQTNTLTPEQRLRRQLGWERRSDQEWGYYFSLLEFAREHQLEVFGADLPSGLKLRLSRSYLDQLNPLEQQQLAMLPEQQGDYRDFMYQRFTDAHCGWGSEELLSKLYRTWRERNHRMARSIEAMTRSERQGPVVLIIGAGHIEHNRGVVSQLAGLMPGIAQLSVGLQQIDIEPAPLSSYRWGESPLARKLGHRYDLLWFTQRQDYRDLCAEMLQK